VTEPFRKSAVANHGWILPELLTVLVLAALLSCALVQTTVCLQRCLTHWEESGRMRRTLAADMFIMSRDIRMAGSNPTGEADFSGAEAIEEEGGAQRGVRIRMDKRGSVVGSRADGDIQDPDETIFYLWDETEEVLRRNSQPLAARIVRNPGGTPVFGLIRDGPRGLLRLSLTTNAADGSLTLSTSVFIRNPS
jgi:type II secretory pathway component PulJ